MFYLVILKLTYRRGFPVDILEAHISGVTAALANLTERGAIEPVVKATVTLSESGFVTVKDAHAFAEVKDDSLTGMHSIIRFGSFCSVPHNSHVTL
jgi:hypoxia up-regulated 1